jgi:hypothetical protein
VCGIPAPAIATGGKLAGSSQLTRPKYAPVTRLAANGGMVFIDMKIIAENPANMKA